MTKKREIKEDDHQHFWVRQFSMSRGKKIWLNLWICRICPKETLVNPHPNQEEEAP